MENLFGEGQSHVGLFVIWIVFDAVLGVGDGESVVLEFYVCEGSVCIVDGYFVVGHSGALGVGIVDGLGVEINCFLELVGLETGVALLFEFLADGQCVLHFLYLFWKYLIICYLQQHLSYIKTTKGGLLIFEYFLFQGKEIMISR